MIRPARLAGAMTPNGLAATPAGDSGASGGIDLAGPAGVYLA